MASVFQILKEGAWETYSAQVTRGPVTFYRWNTVTANGTSPAFPTAEAVKVYAYLGDVAAPVTAGNINIHTDTAASGITGKLPYSLPLADPTTGVERNTKGTLHGTTQASNTRAVSRDLSASSVLVLDSLAGTVPDVSIIIEVHKG